MRLTSFSDYALRLLMFVATRPGELVTIGEISRAYGISRNHLMKIAATLSQAGLVVTVRGSGGGLRLARPAGEVSVGAVVRITEAGSDLVECANTKTNTCVIAPVCELKHALFKAQEAFYDTLDGVSLSDISRNQEQLKGLLPDQAA